MLLEAVYHRPKMNWAYAYDDYTLHLRLRTKKGDMTEVHAWVGDKYAWDQTEELVPMKLVLSDKRFDYWECEVKPPFRRLKYGFLLQDGHESMWMTENDFYTERPGKPDRLYDFPFINPVDVFRTPAWVKDAVFYQIFPERFANGDPGNDPENVQPWGGKPEVDNYFGGDLQGVIDHLDHLSELGITAIYFTPIFAAATNHKYDTEDYRKIDPHFGDAEKLKELVQLCHDRGIRVLLDAVFNHAGRTFAPFVDVLEKGEQSKYKDWFHIHEFPLTDKDGRPNYDTFSFEKHMPKLNTENPEVKEYLLGTAEYWIREIGIDGWRLDIANEVDHHFWREFRRRIKALNPDAYILGEIWHEASPWLQGDQFDAVMNYPFTDAVLDFVARGTLNTSELASAIQMQLSRYPRQANEVLFNLLDSHDTPRLLTMCEGSKAKMKLAAVIQFTYSGTPCIYYGDEYGLDGGPDPDCRKCMPWEPEQQDRELFDFYKALIAIRKAHPALRTGSIHFKETGGEGTLLAYERWLNRDRVLVLINKADQAQAFQLPKRTGRSMEAGKCSAPPSAAACWTTLFASDSVQLQEENGQEMVRLPAFGFAVLGPAKED